MRNAPPTASSAHLFRPTPAGAIEWEELPSLAGRLDILGEPSNQGRPPNGHTVWDSTRPADLEPAVASGPFKQPMDGVEFREVVEPDVFRHFFGR